MSGKLLVALDLYGAIGDVSQHKAPFTDLVRHAGELLNLSVSDASTIKGNILERKTKRTTFIDALRASLESDGFGRGLIFNPLQRKVHPMVHLVVPFLFFVFGTLPAKETKTAMSYEQLIDDMQKSIFILQKTLDMIKIHDDRFAQHVLFTRTEAADYIGVSTRQFDRYCAAFNIPKVKTLQGLRFRKADILAHWDIGHRNITFE